MDTPTVTTHRAPGEILRDLRKVLAPEGSRKLTQGALAERLGYDEGYLQSIESGRRPLGPHLVDKLAQLDDDARFPDAFARLIEELRASVEAHRAAEAARPPVIGGPPGDKPASTGAPSESVASKLEDKLDALRVTMDGLSARAKGRLDGLGGKLDRTEGTLSVLGNKLETTSVKTEATLGALRSEVDAASAKTEAMLGALGGGVEAASTRTEEALAALRGQVEGASARTEEVLGALGGQVDTASARTEEALGALGGKVDAAFARAAETLGVLGGRVDATSSRTEGQLNEVAAKVADAGNKLDRADAKLESVRTQAAQAEKKVTRKLDMLIRVLGANFVGVTALFILHCHHSQSAVQPARGATASIGVGGGAAEVAPKNRCSDDPTPCNDIVDPGASSQLGKKEPEENWIPSEPWKWQKPPPCNEKAGEEAINGGCWQRIDVKPPCGDQLWRKGDKCYRPISVKPKRPVGDEPRRPIPERQ
ncbi:MAG TPA: helix-turn-helix domain-containing protein [Myxococcaceae bacterium]|nr:helix-turn-helix domain-containing protein [Myxococcaceae bacterium]